MKILVGEINQMKIQLMDFLEIRKVIEGYQNRLKKKLNLSKDF